MKKVTFSLVLLMAGALSSFALNATKYTNDGSAKSSKMNCEKFCSSRGGYVEFKSKTYCECKK